MSRHPLINPFRYIAGMKALVTGILVLLLTAVVAWKSNTHFDGVLDAHFGAETSLNLYLVQASVNWLCLVAVFYVAGLLLASSSIRPVDIAGTMAFARLPMLGVALTGFFVTEAQADIKSIEPTMIVIIIITLFFSIWMITWMYQAYVTCTNLKGAKATVSFIVLLIVAEIISKIIFSINYFDSFILKL